MHNLKVYNASYTANYLKNFQTGLAVDDVKEILSTAEVRKLKSKVNLATVNNPFDLCIPLQIDLIVSMNRLTHIWYTILFYALLPVVIIVVCFICPCLICYCVYAVYRDKDDEDVVDNLVGWYFSFNEYILQESEPKISTTTVYPFKLRSPLSASKRYKSPTNLAKIIEKPSPEVSNIIYTSYIILLLYTHQ